MFLMIPYGVVIAYSSILALLIVTMGSYALMTSGIHLLIAEFALTAVAYLIGGIIFVAHVEQYIAGRKELPLILLNEMPVKNLGGENAMAIYSKFIAGQQKLFRRGFSPDCRRSRLRPRTYRHIGLISGN